MLTLRLQTLLETLPPVNSVLDVGTDHCLLPIAIKEKYPMMKVAASDVSIGPLNSAKKNLDLHKMQDISLYLSNGLSNIPIQYECVIMAGMGSQTMIQILNDCDNYARKCNYLLLQPNTEVDVLRKWLFTHGYSIIDETMIFDYKYYQILLVGIGKQDYREEDIVFGPILRTKQTQIYLDYWKKEYQKLLDILARLPRNHVRRPEIMHLLDLIYKNIKDKKSEF